MITSKDAYTTNSLRSFRSDFFWFNCKSSRGRCFFFNPIFSVLKKVFTNSTLAVYVEYSHIHRTDRKKNNDISLRSDQGPCFCSIGMGGGKLHGSIRPPFLRKMEDKRRAQVRSRSPKVGFNMGSTKTTGFGGHPKTLVGFWKGNLWDIFSISGKSGWLKYYNLASMLKQMVMFFLISSCSSWLTFLLPMGFSDAFFFYTFQTKKSEDPKVHRISTA